MIDDEKDPQMLGHVERCAEMLGAPRNVATTFFFGPPENPDGPAAAVTATNTEFDTCKRIKLGVPCMRDLHAYCRCLHFDGETCIQFPVSPAEDWWGSIGSKAGIEPRTLRIYKKPAVKSEPLIQHSRDPIALVITLGSFTGGVIASED